MHAPLLAALQEAFYALDEDGDGHLTPAELTHALRSTDALAKSGFAAEIPPEALEELIAASDLYGEGYVDVDEFLAAMLANSNYTKTKDAVRVWCSAPCAVATCALQPAVSCCGAGLAACDRDGRAAASAAAAAAAM
jgi:hypothetical protein